MKTMQMSWSLRLVCFLFKNVQLYCNKIVVTAFYSPGSIWSCSDHLSDADIDIINECTYKNVWTTYGEFSRDTIHSYWRIGVDKRTRAIARIAKQTEDIIGTIISD